MNFTFSSFAQDPNKLASLSKQALDAKSAELAYPALEELKELYLGENKYKEFIDFLKSAASQKKQLAGAVNYYIALSRYYQLKYIEDTLNWDEYFSSGNSYREEIIQCAQKAIDSSEPKNNYRLLARLVLWRLHRDQQDNLNEASLEQLFKDASAYGNGSKDPLLVKYVADQLFSYGEKEKSRSLYKLYVDRLVASDIKDEELRAIGLDFLEENNLELAEAVFDIYLDRGAKLYPKEKLEPILKELAAAFSMKNPANDPFYAEALFAKIEEKFSTAAFDQELMYLRAMNLEKIKEYAASETIYSLLLKVYPGALRADEINYKLGMIRSYIFRDLKGGKDYFQALARKDAVNPYTLCALYQLGLLSQWEEDFTKAKEYYFLLSEKGSLYQELLSLCRAREKEIRDGKSIEYSLKTFLDVSFKNDYTNIDMKNSDLKAKPYKARPGEDVGITSTVYKGESGCTHLEYQYLWSGSLGKVSPRLGDYAFNTSYSEAGVKEINLVVISPAGIADRNIDFIDVE